MTTYPLRETQHPSETALQACIRVSQKFKRILSYPEIEELVGGEKDYCQQMRAELVHLLPELPALRTQGDLNFHDQTHENKGFKKRKCLKCRKEFVSHGAGNRLCRDCKDSPIFSGDHHYYGLGAR